MRDLSETAEIHLGYALNTLRHHLVQISFPSVKNVTISRCERHISTGEKPPEPEAKRPSPDPTSQPHYKTPGLASVGLLLICRMLCAGRSL